MLKVYKVSGNYKSRRLLEHTEYEAAFIKKLMHADLKLAHIRANQQNKQVVLLDKFPVVLYHFEQGRIFKYPNPQYPISQATQTLSQLHQIQLNQAFKLSQAFSFDDVFNLWYPEFYRFKAEVKLDVALTDDFERLDFVYQQLADLYKKIKSNQLIPCIHNHGDVTPRNFVIENDAAIVIDFQNAFYGPRVLDVIDGAYEFSFGGKPPGVDDFSRFNAFITAYQQHSELNIHELAILNDVIKVCGVIKFVKEVRMIKGATNKNNLRRTRALSLSQFLIKRYDL